MFNQVGFNRVPFNRPFSLNVYGSFFLEASGELVVTANISASPSFDLEAIGGFDIQSVREQFGSFLLESLSDLEADAVRERRGSFILEAEGELVIAAGRMHVDYIDFVGEFKPGDRIIIDSNTLKMTINGQNALHLMQGDFFDLNTGSNELVYTDDKTGQTVRMRVTYKDKFV